MRQMIYDVRFGINNEANFHPEYKKKPSNMNGHLRGLLNFLQINKDVSPIFAGETVCWLLSWRINYDSCNNYYSCLVFLHRPGSCSKGYTDAEEI